MLGHTIIRGTLGRKLHLLPISGAFGFDPYYLSNHCNSHRSYSAKNQDKRDPHDVLGLHRRASKKEIKSAYIRLSKLYHPDRNQANPIKAAQEFNELREAYEDLLTRPIENSREQQRSDSDSPDQWQGERETDQNNRTAYNNYTHSRAFRKKSRSVDDWIKEVEKNARMRKQQAKYESSKNTSSPKENSGYYHEHGNNKYNYTSTKGFKEDWKFWKPSENMKYYEKHHGGFESRLLNDIDRMVEYYSIKNRLEAKVEARFVERGFSKIILIYLIMIKFLLKSGWRFLLCFVGFLLAVEMSYDDMHD